MARATTTRATEPTTTPAQAAWCGVGERHNFEKQVYGPRRRGAPADEPDVELGFHDALRVARLVAKGDQMTLEILLSPLAYVEEAPCVAELRYLAVRRTFGWRSAAKLGLASGKAGKQLGYALHRTLSAEWLLRERDVVGLPQGLPELLDGAIRA